MNAAAHTARMEPLISPVPITRAHTADGERAPLTVALWQTPYADEAAPEPSPQAMAHTLERLDAAAAQARAAGAHLLVTPEMVLTGYHRASDWLRAVAQPADGPWAQAVARIAQRHGLAVVYGYPQAAAPGQRPYNAAQALGPDGRALANHRKVYLFGQVDAERFSGGPPVPTTFVYRGWCLGLLICYDVEFAGPVQALAEAGAHAMLVPTANMPEYDAVQRDLLPRQAREHGVHLVYANACGAETGMAPGLVYGGLSTVVDPNGQVLARAQRAPSLLVATLRA
jgi:5-aminopentanamidase